MPKMKSHRGAKKRLRVTGTGKLVHKRAGRNHLLYGKSASRRRRLRSAAGLSKGDAARTKALMPYDQ